MGNELEKIMNSVAEELREFPSLAELLGEETISFWKSKLEEEENIYSLLEPSRLTLFTMLFSIVDSRDKEYFNSPFGLGHVERLHCIEQCLSLLSHSPGIEKSFRSKLRNTESSQLLSSLSEMFIGRFFDSHGCSVRFEIPYKLLSLNGSEKVRDVDLLIEKDNVKFLLEVYNPIQPHRGDGTISHCESHLKFTNMIDDKVKRKFGNGEETLAGLPACPIVIGVNPIFDDQENRRILYGVQEDEFEQLLDRIVLDNRFLDGVFIVQVNSRAPIVAQPHSLTTTDEGLRDFFDLHGVPSRLCR